MSTPPSTRPPSEPARSSPVNDFDFWAERYRTNYIAYKTSGNEANKVLYERAKQVLDDFVNARERELQVNSQKLEKYVDDITGGGDSATLRKRIQESVTNGPKLYDQLMTQEKASATILDYQSLWVKGVIAVSILGVIGVISFVY